MGEMDARALEAVIADLSPEGRQALRHLLANAVAPLGLVPAGDLDPQTFAGRATIDAYTKVLVVIRGLDAADRRAA